MFNEIHLNELHRENDSEKKMKLLFEKNTNCFEANVAIYLCLIKAVAKLGILERAQSFIQQIPSSVLSDYRIRNTLIHM